MIPCTIITLPDKGVPGALESLLLQSITSIDARRLKCWKDYLSCWDISKHDVTTQAKNNLSDITDPIDRGNLEENGKNKKQHQDSRHDYSSSGFCEHEGIDKEKDYDQVDNGTIRNTPHDLTFEFVI